MSWYAQKAQPLQIRKTALLRGSPLAGRPRQEWAKKTRYGDPTDEELQSFEILQDNFKTCTDSKLVHWDDCRQASE